MNSVPFTLVIIVIKKALKIVIIDVNSRHKWRLFRPEITKYKLSCLVKIVMLINFVVLLKHVEAPVIETKAYVGIIET